MAVVFLLKSFDGTAGGVTSFEVHLEGEGCVATSEGAYWTPEAATDDVRRFVMCCQYQLDYAVDMAVDRDTWTYVALFPDPRRSRHIVRTTPCGTPGESERVVDTIMASVRAMGEQIALAGPVFDAPTDIVDRPTPDGWAYRAVPAEIDSDLRSSPLAHAKYSPSAD